MCPILDEAFEAVIFPCTSLYVNVKSEYKGNAKTWEGALRNFNQLFAIHEDIFSECKEVPLVM